MISIGAQAILKMMIAAEADENWEDSELVCEGRECWLGSHKTKRSIVNELLRACLIRDCSDTNEKVERYTINSDGRLTADDPAYINPALRERLKAAQL